jgi:nitrogen fixation/metabolism regulation signal transduction histidine kinase
MTASIEQQVAELEARIEAFQFDGYDDAYLAPLRAAATTLRDHARLQQDARRKTEALEYVRKHIRDVFIEDHVEDMISCRNCIDKIDSAMSSGSGL